LYGNLGELLPVGPAGGAAAIAIAWVVIAEVDQAFAAFVAAGSESVGIVKAGDTAVVGLVAVIVVAGRLLPGGRHLRADGECGESRRVPLLDGGRRRRPAIGPD